MTRLEAIAHLSTKYPYDKNAKKLSTKEIDLIRKFVSDNDNLNHLDFEYAVNRIFLSNSHNINQKKQAIIQELLSCANSAVNFKRK